MKRVSIQTSTPNSLRQQVYLGVLGLLTLLSLVVLHRGGTRPIAREMTRPAASALMPNLNGNEAKTYLKQQGLQQSLAEAIRAARYGINWVKQAPIPNQGGAFQAANPQQGYSAYFANDQMHLVSRSADENWRVAMKLTTYGYGTEQSALGGAQWSVAETRIERVLTSVSGVSGREFGVPLTTDSRLATADSGPIVEWYENRPEGLEQGFTIKAPPDSHLQSPDARLRLELELEGDLRARVVEEGQALSFVKEGQGATVVHYGKLKSTDVNGKELVSRMELQNNKLSLLVDDHDAVYPLTIDPLFTQLKKITAPDANQSALFGSGVALSGDTIIVGAPSGFSTNQGSAYIFERNQGGGENWALVKELTAPDGLNPDLFGWSVAISGDTIIVGAFQHKVGDYLEAGAVYIFDRNLGGANNWGLVKELTSSDGTVNDHFGYSVTTNGDTAIIGMTNYNHVDNKITRSAVYIYGRDQGGANNWGEVKIISMTGGQNDSEGYAVAMSGDTAVIGAPKHFNPGPPSIGAAFIIERDAGGPNNWGIVKTVTTGQPLTNDRFGVTVAIEGNKVLVGAGEYIEPGENLDNAAYLFERNTGGPDNWGLVKKIVASDDASGNAFAFSLSINNDTAVVGAPGAQVGANVQRGAVYVFKQNAGGSDNWGQVKKIVAADGASGDLFGWSVALEGKTLVVGAPLDDGAILDQGSAYLNQSVNVSWIEDAKAIPVNCTVDGRFGWSVSISGDTAIVGAPNIDVGANVNQGTAYVFQRDHDGTNAWGMVLELASSDGTAESNFGWSVDISGDKVIVGAYLHGGKGAAYVFERNAGGANNWGETKKILASDGAANDQFGYSVSINGDRVVVGAIGESDRGAAYIFERDLGGPNNWGQVKEIFSAAGASDDSFGNAVAVSGNTIVVGAQQDDQPYEGAAYVFERDAGGQNNWGTSKKLTPLNEANLNQFGHAVAIRGDTIIVGDFYYTGSAYVFGRNAEGPDSWGLIKQLIASDPGSYHHFGSAVDIDADTIVVGSDCGSPTAFSTCEGSAYIFKQNAGGADNWGETKRLLASDRAAYDYFGISVAVSNGVAIIGASGHDVNSLNDINGHGASYVFADTGTDWIEQAKPLAPLPTNCGTADQYGFSVAIDGDTAVTGAPFDDIGISKDQGSVYVLERNQGGPNHWGLVKILIAADGAQSDHFGNSVAIDDNTIVVGAIHYDVGTPAGLGSAYIFERNHGGVNNWGQVKKLTSSDGGPADGFGGSVAISANTIVVGAGSDTITQLDQGSAYVFERNSGGANNWGETKKLWRANGRPVEHFGHSVGISKDTLIIGKYDIFSPPNEVYIYERNQGGANNWGEVKTLISPDDLFGFSVALDGNTAIVGAAASEIGANQSQGAAYIFGRNAGGANNWGEVRKIVAADGAVQDFFGISVSISGDTAIVGAYHDVVGAILDQGSAYLFEQNAGGADNWGQVQHIVASDGGEADEFGYSVDISGDDFIIGAYKADISLQSANKTTSTSSSVANDQGAAYVFRGVASVAPTAAVATISGRIITATGAPLGGALVVLAGGVKATTITNSDGYYSFANIEAGALYSVTPSKTNYTFNPVSRAFSLLGNITNAEFTAIPDSTPGQNPLDVASFFVRQHYFDFLNRDSDANGLAFWTGQITSCGGDAQCLEVKRINVSASFFLSIEFQETGYLVYQIYKSSYGNLPNAPVPIRLNEFLPDTQEIRQGVIVNQTGWKQVLENNKQAFLAEFVQRSRFTSAYPTSLTPDQFVDQLFLNAGVTPSATDRTAANNEFGSATMTTDTAARARALRRVAENSTFARQEFNRAFVLMEYFGYLRRNPNDPPEATLDFQGYNFWLTKLNQFNGNFIEAEMVKAFLVSTEYRQRFGP